MHIPFGQAIEVLLRNTRGKQLDTSRGTRILYHTVDGEEIWTSIDESRQIQGAWFSSEYNGTPRLTQVIDA